MKRVEDFQGLKIRTMSNRNHMAFWSALGANPTPLAWPELYFSLQSGIVDAEENAADSILSANFNEVQKYVAETNVILIRQRNGPEQKSLGEFCPRHTKRLWKTRSGKPGKNWHPP